MYYVYAHLDPVSLKPFYIGKGKNDRFYSGVDRSIWWSNHTNKHGFIPVKLVENLTNEQACEIEKQYIKKYGFKKCGGLLINQTLGGNGGNTFDPVNGKNWNSGKTGVYSEETIHKIRMSRVGKKLKPHVKEKVLAGLKKAKLKQSENSMKVECLTTGKVWNNRVECAKDLGITMYNFKQRIFIDKPRKGYHLKYIK